MSFSHTQKWGNAPRAALQKKDIGCVTNVSVSIKKRINRYKPALVFSIKGVGIKKIDSL